MFCRVIQCLHGFSLDNSKKGSSSCLDKLNWSSVWISVWLCVMCPVLDLRPFRGVFLPYAQFFQDSIWIHHDSGWPGWSDYGRWLYEEINEWLTNYYQVQPTTEAFPCSTWVVPYLLSPVHIVFFTSTFSGHYLLLIIQTSGSVQKGLWLDMTNKHID